MFCFFPWIHTNVKLFPVSLRPHGPWLWYSPKRWTHSIGPEQQHTWSTLIVLLSSGPLLHRCRGLPFKAPAISPFAPVHPLAKDNHRTCHCRSLNNKASKQKPNLKTSCRENTTVCRVSFLPSVAVYDVLGESTCVVQPVMEISKIRQSQ